MDINLSIIVPVLNEEAYIQSLIDTLLNSPPSAKEVFIVDGGSTDNTLNIVQENQKKHKNIIFVENKEKSASHAFNKAFKEATGRYIAFIGAHAIYSKNYFSYSIELLNQNKCDVVGGILKQVGKSAIGNIIAKCMSSIFGVGGTEFRTSMKESYVQSVAFAVYKREVIEEIGLMNTNLVRNQDDEFHYRIVDKGFRILMTPEISATYYVRNSLGKLFKQYFEYGLYKPLVLRNVKSGIRVRHLVPTFFVLYLIFFMLFPTIIATIPIVIYFLLNTYFSLKYSKNIHEFIYSIFTFLTLHVAYGTGFIVGITKINNK